ncbi:hypothetical protein PVK06_001953 [Gossypium arboreum]|uniref:DUF7745 domain-containing protein n=1 Tax=Gossypium arboreum TaxID=29729 RepID=A0ABR0R2I0_GOSAR|nr:hypothetical protein PVK06_001953 [Gossypium arboreum]
MDIDLRVANATVYAMEVLPPKCQPFLKGERIPMDVVFKPWVSRALELAKSAQDILEVERQFLGTLSQSDRLTIDTVKVRLKYKNGPCISWSNIRDAMGKASGDRHLTLFAFVVYGLIVLSKVLRYVGVELANFLFQIEKGVNLTPAVLAETPIEDFLESEWPPNQSTEEWVQNLSTLTYQEIEWRAPWMIRSTILVGCNGHLWVPLIGILEVINYSSLMVLRQYEYDQYVPTTTGLNSVEFLV